MPGERSSGRDVSSLLRAWSEGDPGAPDQLTPIVYDELRRSARYCSGGEKPGPSLQAAALVHETYTGLEPAERFDLGIPGSWAGFYGNLYSPYVRGLAYLSAHKGPEAAAQFQTIVDHRQIVWSDPVGAMARLQLGRAWNMASDSGKAKAAHQDFLTLWKDADPEAPISSKPRRNTPSCRERAIAAFAASTPFDGKVAISYICLDGLAAARSESRARS